MHHSGVSEAYSGVPEAHRGVPEAVLCGVSRPIVGFWSPQQGPWGPQWGPAPISSTFFPALTSYLKTHMEGLLKGVPATWQQFMCQIPWQHCMCCPQTEIGDDTACVSHEQNTWQHCMCQPWAEIHDNSACVSHEQKHMATLYVSAMSRHAIFFATCYPVFWIKLTACVTCRLFMCWSKDTAQHPSVYAFKRTQ